MQGRRGEPRPLRPVDDEGPRARAASRIPQADVELPEGPSPAGPAAVLRVSPGHAFPRLDDGQGHVEPAVATGQFLLIRLAVMSGPSRKSRDVIAPMTVRKEVTGLPAMWPR